MSRNGGLKFKFVRQNSTSAPAKGVPKANKTKGNLEASLRARAKKGDVPTEVEKEFLPWGEYLGIRRNKRRWETVRAIV